LLLPPNLHIRYHHIPTLVPPKSTIKGEYSEAEKSSCPSEGEGEEAEIPARHAECLGVVDYKVSREYREENPLEGSSFKNSWRIET
jgi:hypothetical protein